MARVAVLAAAGALAAAQTAQVGAEFCVCVLRVAPCAPPPRRRSPSPRPARPTVQLTVVTNNVTNPSVNRRFMGCHSDPGFTHQTRGWTSNLIYGTQFQPAFWNYQQVNGSSAYCEAVVMVSARVGSRGGRGEPGPCGCGCRIA
jgi:hypothetical protein